MKPIVVSLAAWLLACGGSTSKMADAPPNVPATITISGTASERSTSGTTPVSDAAVAAYSNSDPSTAVAMAMTDAQGNYSLMVTTNGKPVDGFVKATKSGYVDTYLFAPAPLTADFAMASINMLTTTTYGLLFTLCQTSQDNTKGTIAVEVMDSSNMTVGGATVSSTPTATKYCYDSPSNGLPSSSATSTNADGIGLMLNVTGSVTVSASKSGSTFKSHTLNATANAFNTTLITE